MLNRLNHNQSDSGLCRRVWLLESKFYTVGYSEPDIHTEVHWSEEDARTAVLGHFLENGSPFDIGEGALDSTSEAPYWEAYTWLDPDGSILVLEVQELYLLPYEEIWQMNGRIHRG